jgi:hypothetical protein
MTPPYISASFLDSYLSLWDRAAKRKMNELEVTTAEWNQVLDRAKMKRSHKCSYCASTYTAERCPSCGASHPAESNLDRGKLTIGLPVRGLNERVVEFERI